MKADSGEERLAMILANRARQGGKNTLMIQELQSRLAEKERVIERYREALLDIASDKRNPPYYDQGAINSFFTAFRLTAKSALQEGEGGK